MQSIDAAIIRTLLYADIFRFAMTPTEIHRHLISDEPFALDSIKHHLSQSSSLRTLIVMEGEYVTLATSANNIRLRKERDVYLENMWDDAIRYGRWLARIPFVRMVALTGALAVCNPGDENDDYDYLLVTQRGRVWIARAIAILLVRLVRLRGRELCPNYVLASDKLVQNRQDLFIAREVAQMFPIYGFDIYERMFAENDWVTRYLPNAQPYPTQVDKPYRMKFVFEKVLGGWFGNMLEEWEYQRKRRKFEPQMNDAKSAAVIDSGQVKGHFNDNGHPVMQEYCRRLKAYGLLTDDSCKIAGD